MRYSRGSTTGCTGSVVIMKMTKPTACLSMSGLALAASVLAGCSDEKPAPAPSSSSAAGQPSQGSPTPRSTDGSPTAGNPGANGNAPAESADLATEPVPVSPEDAINTARAESGDAGVTSIDLEFERRHDTWVYSVELQDQAKDYEIDIDAVNGSVLASESERVDEPEVTVSPTDPLPYADALKLAQDQGQGRLTGWSLGEDDGAIEYTFEFGDEPDDIEVVVDAKTKRVYVDD